ncbi:MAG: glycerate kinase [Bacteroidota bacterium]
MKILIAPDSFKGTLTAVEAAQAMAEGARSVVPDAVIVELPIADGGEGTVEALVRATGGKTKKATVTGPLGFPTVATWGILGDGTTAVLEMASASGLTLLTREQYQPRKTTTFGTGELIRAALDERAKKVVIGIGGSATNDGGAGAAEALGARFHDEKGIPIGRGGEALAHLEHIDLSGLDPRLGDVQIVVACDVDNVLCGPDGASAVYGPQKGATRNDVEILDRALHHYADVILRSMGIDVRPLRGGGAAGGLGAGLTAFCGAHLSRGVDLILDALGFDQHLRNADVVLTGEGRIDSQLKFGKALAGILERAGRNSVPVLGLAGFIEGPPEQYCGRGIFADVGSLTAETVSIDDAMNNAYQLVRHRTSDLLNRWLVKNPQSRR